MNELRRKAIGLLARREHSRAELARKLAADGTEEDIATVLAQLEAEGLLSDARAAAAYVRAHDSFDNLVGLAARKSKATQGAAREILMHVAGKGGAEGLRGQR